MDLIGLPLILPIRAAAPAVEPKSIEPAFRNSSALLEPSDCTQRTLMPSFSSSFSRKPLSLRSRLTGLYVAKSILISLGCAMAPLASNVRLVATEAARRRRRVRLIVLVPCLAHGSFVRRHPAL